jgi:hypothetical protein
MVLVFTSEVSHRSTTSSIETKPVRIARAAPKTKGDASHYVFVAFRHVYGLAQQQSPARPVLVLPSLLDPGAGLSVAGKRRKTDR